MIWTKGCTRAKTWAIAGCVLIGLFFCSGGYAQMIGPFPGLQKLIDEADAIVVVRIDRQVEPNMPRTGPYMFYDCLIYQTLKGEIPQGKVIRLSLADLRSRGLDDLPVYSTHLMFLQKRDSAAELADYSTIPVIGANIALPRIGMEQTPAGDTVYERIVAILKATKAYNQARYEEEQTFLQQMIEGKPIGFSP